MYLIRIPNFSHESDRPSTSNTGSFLTLAAEKTKTQEKNSSQKLKEKTQPLGGFSLQDRKLKKKTKISS